MREFLHALFESGHVSVAPVLAPGSKEDLAAVIQDFDRAARLNFATDAPKLDLEVASWAATLLYRACQLVVLRNLDAAEVARPFQVPCPSARNPVTDYSADLFLRYWPDLHVIARRLAADDPLVTQIEKVAADWPLSSVGIKNIERCPIDSFIHDPSLRQLYLDRIIEQKAVHLAQEPKIAEQIRASYGAFPELCPEMSDALAATSDT